MMGQGLEQMAQFKVVGRPEFAYFARNQALQTLGFRMDSLGEIGQNYDSVFYV
jgi:hypothetical protein